MYTLDLTRQALASATERLQQAIRAIPDDQWNVAHDDEAWSAAQLVEHLAIVEASTLRLLTTRFASGTEPKPPASWASERTREEISDRDAEIVTKLGDITEKRKAPEMVAPTGRFATREEAVAAFTQGREQTLAFAAAATEEELRKRMAPHPAIGPIDGIQWLLFMAFHGDRHALQLESITHR